jgi:hypothetical protein
MRLNLYVVAVGALAIAFVSLPVVAGASPSRAAPGSELSARTKEDLKSKRKKAQKRNIDAQKKPAAPVVVAPRVVSPSAVPKPARRVFTLRSANSRLVIAPRIRGVPMRGAARTSIGGRNYSIWRSGYRLRGGGTWRTFVALGTLGSLTIGATEYLPYAFLDAPAESCDGMTEDGCQLVWDDVETLEGGAVGQCVAYCPAQ